jgi:hypothetical protein
MRAGQATIVAVSAILFIPLLTPSVGGWTSSTIDIEYIPGPKFIEVWVSETMEEGQQLDLSLPGLEEGGRILIQPMYLTDRFTTTVERPDGTTTVPLKERELAMEADVPGTYVIRIRMEENDGYTLHVELKVWYGSPAIGLVTPPEGSTVNSQMEIEGYCNFWPDMGVLEMSKDGTMATDVEMLDDNVLPAFSSFEPPTCLIDGEEAFLFYCAPMVKWKATVPFTEGLNRIDARGEVDSFWDFNGTRFVVENTLLVDYDPCQVVSCRLPLPPVEEGDYLSLVGESGIIAAQGSFQLVMDVREGESLRVQWKSRDIVLASRSVDITIKVNGTFQDLYRQVDYDLLITEDAIIERTGQMEITWTNRDDHRDALIDFTISMGKPEVRILFPEGNELDDASPILRGEVNLIADKVEVSTDNVTFVTASVSQERSLDLSTGYLARAGTTTFTAPLHLRHGGNIVYVRVSSSDHPYGEFDTAFHYELDTTWSYTEDGEPHLGYGAYILTISLASIAATLATFTWWRRSG